MPCKEGAMHLAALEQPLRSTQLNGFPPSPPFAATSHWMTAQLVLLSKRLCQCYLIAIAKIELARCQQEARPL